MTIFIKSEKRLGVQLAREHPVKADFVMGIPDSGPLRGYCYAQGIRPAL